MTSSPPSVLRAKATPGGFARFLTALRCAILACAFAHAVCAWSAPGSGASDSFDEANALFEKGNYREAAALYEALTRSNSASSAVFYNLGNAWFKAGEIGRAIAAYRAAQELAPRDPDIRANLQFARDLVRPPTFKPARWQSWLSTLSLSEWAMAANAGFWLCLLGLAAVQLRPRLWPAVRWYVFALGGITFVLGGCLATALMQKRGAALVVAVAPDTPVRRGPLEESPALFSVHNGAELRVLDRNKGWLRVTADPTRSGWIPASQVIQLP